MTDFKAKMHQIRFRQTPLGELTALPRLPCWIWGPLRGRGGAGLGKRRERGRGRGGRRKWRGEKGRAPKLLLNQGPPETCYATAPIPPPVQVQSVLSVQLSSEGSCQTSQSINQSINDIDERGHSVRNMIKNTK